MPYRKVGALEACWYMIRYKLKEALRMPKFPDHPCAHPRKSAQAIEESISRLNIE